jgi:hypothetical protein
MLNNMRILYLISLLVVIGLFPVAAQSVQGKFANGFNISSDGEFTLRSSVNGRVRSFNIASISGFIFDKDENPMKEAEVFLIRIPTSGPVDTLGEFKTKEDGAFAFLNKPKGTYILVANPNFELYPKSLPTFYGDTINWEGASPIELEEDLENINISVRELFEVEKGQNSVLGYVERELTSSGRVLERKRIGKAGVSVSRAMDVNRFLSGSAFVVVAFVYTNDEGEFEFPNLPDGRYRINIQYPGFPMNPNSFVEFTLNKETESVINLKATIELNGEINVQKIEPTGLRQDTNLPKVKVYPNPASNVVKVNLSGVESTIKSIALLDFSGREVFNKIYSQSPIEIEEIPLQSYKPGTYIICLTLVDGQKVFISRLIIIR